MEKLASNPDTSNTLLKEKEPSRLGSVLERLNEGRDQIQESGVRTRMTVLSDNRHLENQEISFIDARDDKGEVEAIFKLTAEQYEAVVSRFEEMPQEINTKGEIKYTSIDGSGDFILANADQIEYEGLNVKIAKPSDSGNQERSSIGLVFIEIPYDENAALKPEGIEKKVNDVLINLLGVPEGLTLPTPEAESQYKEARYRWHHKLPPSGPLNPEQTSEIAKLERREVFPEYHTMVSDGKHQEYEQDYGEFALFHEIRSGSGDRIVRILKSGLMSSHERFQRGMLDGSEMSLTKDFEKGGADSVFVRTVVDGSPNLDDSKNINDGTYNIIMGPELYDRTDWYAYDNDFYGTTDDVHFVNRQSPKEVLENQKTNGYSCANEQMFRTGISSGSFKAIACKDQADIRNMVGESLKLGSEEISELWDKGPEAVREVLDSRGIDKINERPVQDVLSEDKRMALIDRLQSEGVFEVNGIPVEQFVVNVSTVDDFIDISNNHPIRSRQAE